MTNEELKEQLVNYQRALTAISKGQNYSIDGMSVTRADLAEVKRTISQLNRAIKSNNRGGGSVRKAVLG